MEIKKYAAAHCIDLNESNPRRIQGKESADNALLRLKQTFPPVQPRRVADPKGAKLSLLDVGLLLVSFLSAVVVAVFCSTLLAMFSVKLHSFFGRWSDWNLFLWFWSLFGPVGPKLTGGCLILWFLIRVALEGFSQFVLLTMIFMAPFFAVRGVTFRISRRVCVRGMYWVRAVAKAAFCASIALALMLATRWYPWLAGSELPVFVAVIYLVVGIGVAFVTLEGVRVCHSCTQAIIKGTDLWMTTLGGARLLIVEILPHRLWHLLSELPKVGSKEEGVLKLWKCTSCGAGILDLTVTLKVSKPPTIPTDRDTVIQEESWMVSTLDVGKADVDTIEAVLKEVLPSKSTKPD
jgi:hypothetical protein